MKYAGIGSRETPAGTLLVMKMIARVLAGQNHLLRSGHARGADQAFESGAGRQTEIFRAGDATPEAFDLAAKYHPAWQNCSAMAQALHARNGMILLGRNLNDPVDFVCCWTPGGAVTGGTGQALRLAEAYAIPVFNLFNDPSGAKLMAWVNAART